MVDPRKQGPQLMGIHFAQDLSHTVGTRFLSSDQPLHPLRLVQLPFHRIQTTLPQDKKKKDTAPEGPQGNAGSPARVFQLGDSLAEIKDLVDIPAEAVHHSRFPLASCFSWKNR
jgi:hypothetical protein